MASAGAPPYGYLLDHTSERKRLETQPMTEAELRMQAQIAAATAHMYGYIAQMEGMKAENAFRDRNGQAMAYCEDSFVPIAQSLHNIATHLLNM